MRIVVNRIPATPRLDQRQIVDTLGRKGTICVAWRKVYNWSSDNDSIIELSLNRERIASNCNAFQDSRWSSPPVHFGSLLWPSYVQSESAPAQREGPSAASGLRRNDN